MKIKKHKEKAWREGELIPVFGLTRIADRQIPILKEWLDTDPVEFNTIEQYIFDTALAKAQKSLAGWNEEELKIKFIGTVLDLGQMTDDNGVVGYFDKTIWAMVEGIKLTVKADFMLAKGVLDVFGTPYFHFQEYTPHLPPCRGEVGGKNPSGDSMAQLLEAFLIAQVKNKNEKPLYGVEIIGKQWSFVVMEGKTYCISKAFDSTDKEGLMSIIAILRKFRKILYERLID